MKNYTEDLKIYWKSKGLTFIATFKWVNKDAGYFNHFMNPFSKMKLYYPEFEGVEVLNKRPIFIRSKRLSSLFFKSVPFKQNCICSSHIVV